MPTRRRLLTACGLAAVPLAGCGTADEDAATPTAEVTPVEVPDDGDAHAPRETASWDHTHVLELTNAGVRDLRALGTDGGAEAGLLVTAGDGVYRLEPGGTGTRWSVGFGERVATMRPTIADGTAFVRTDTDRGTRLHAIALEDGNTRWTRAWDAAVDVFGGDEDRLFLHRSGRAGAGGSSHELLVVSTADGSTLASTGTGNPIDSVVEPSGPVISERDVITAFDRQGNERWRVDAEVGWNSLASDGLLVYHYGPSGPLVARRGDGDDVWQVERRVRRLLATDHLYLADGSGNFLSLSRGGDLRWQSGTGEPTVEPASGRVLVHGGMPGAEHLDARSTADGELRWRFVPQRSPLRVYDDRDGVAIVTAGRHLGLHAHVSRPVASEPLEGSVGGGLVADGRAYAGTSEGRIFVFERG